MTLESSVKAVAKELNPLDFASGLYDGAIKQPLSAVRQLAGEKVAAQDSRDDSLAKKGGHLAGFILDFSIVSRLTGGAVNKALAEATASGITGAGARMFVAGGLYGGLLTASSNEKGLLAGRLENALVSGTSFAVMGGVGKVLEGTGVVAGHEILGKIGANAVAGGAGGVVESYGSVFANEHRRASFSEVIGTAGSYALFGAGFGALDVGVNKGVQYASPKVESAYWSARYNLGEAKTEARRAVYTQLNEWNLRHPLQRLGNFVYGADFSLEPSKVALTAENNPITAFKSELPEFYKRVEAKEDQINDETDRSKRYDLHEEQKSIREEFAFKLLQLWHGTAEQPGIRYFTDEQLATAGVDAAQVAKIRNALSLSAKADYPNASPLTTALADIAGVELSGRRGGEDTYGLLGEIDKAKARFYNYDEYELAKRMSMGQYNHWKDHNPRTPLEWMPYEPTDQVANLFHGTVSNSLPLLFTERVMLPAKELRLRGISQITGESANEEFPRRSISITRDFSEAWAYHRHSPTYLTGHPIVFGISQDVIPNARYAGMVEPGEILVDKLRLGDSLATKLGIRKPEITHLYVPDSEVGNVNRMLLQYRISGVNVVGLGEMKAPEMKPQPEIDPDLKDIWE